MTSPGGGTPSVSQKRSMAKRARDSQSPDIISRKKAKVESACTPTTLPREKNDPKRPHKAVSHNVSFRDEAEAAELASQLDFSTHYSQGEIVVISQKEESQNAFLGSQEDNLEPATLETLGEGDEEMAAENVGSEDDCEGVSSGLTDSSVTPNISQIIHDERSKDSVLETPAHASLDTTQDFVDADSIAVKAVDFAPVNLVEKAEQIEQAAASAASLAATSDTAPAPDTKSGYCSVM